MTKEGERDLFCVFYAKRKFRFDGIFLLLLLFNAFYRHLNRTELNEVKKVIFMSGNNSHRIKEPPKSAEINPFAVHIFPYCSFFYTSCECPIHSVCMHKFKASSSSSLLYNVPSQAGIYTNNEKWLLIYRDCLIGFYVATYSAPFHLSILQTSSVMSNHWILALGRPLFVQTNDF